LGSAPDPAGELTAHHQLDLREPSKWKDRKRRGREGKAENGQERTGSEGKGGEIVQF